MHMNIGIDQDKRKAAAGRWQQILADEFVLYTKTLNYHWNVVSPNFSGLHEFYETQYNELSGWIDEIAERIRALGELSAGRLEDFLKQTRLPEQGYTTDANEQLANLLQDHETLIRTLREAITEFDEKHQDLGSSDFANELLGKHEKMAWMIRSHLG